MQGRIQSKVDRTKAISLYQQAIKCEKGEGCPVDYKEAMSLYLNAGLLGHGGAMSNVANMFMLGLGVEVNPAKAYEYYQTAKAMGDEAAALNLKLMEQTFASQEKLAMLQNIVGSENSWALQQKSPTIQKIDGILTDQFLSSLEKAIHIWQVAAFFCSENKDQSLEGLLCFAINNDDMGELKTMERSILEGEFDKKHTIPLLIDIVSNFHYWQDKGNTDGIGEINRVLVQQQLSESEKIKAIVAIAKAENKKPSPTLFNNPLNEKVTSFYNAIIRGGNKKLEKLANMIANERRASYGKTKLTSKEQTFRKDEERMNFSY